ncbi:PH domain-containing protein [Martelella alba]|uniref:Oligomerization/nucleic acid binding protein n=1 Tax=Martelella alba TaxID=2590451 RepID=A0ABY2SNX9_9HYPH|nr:PH domain-containing protein [Martelella alba]TKI05464.1 hypothetical protein FCN80_13910 [Martelella alba]
MIDYKTATNDELKIEFKRLSKLAGDMPLGTRKEFYHLPAILREQELPLAVAAGSMGGNIWLITLTSQRILFLDRSAVFGLKQINIELAGILSVSSRIRMMAGSITLNTLEQDYTIENIIKGAVIPFANRVNAAREALRPSSVRTGPIGKSAPEPVVDMIIQLEKLASLKERGILSEEEFSTQKAKILAM